MKKDNPVLVIITAVLCAAACYFLYVVAWAVTPTGAW